LHGTIGVVGMDEKAVRTSGVVGCLLLVLPVDWADVVGESVGGVVEYCGLCLLGDLVNFDSGVAGNLVLLVSFLLLLGGDTRSSISFRLVFFSNMPTDGEVT
jgi:hypothetical protein